ncbi:hypothetical protein [Kribbella sandramycini]|uniref:ABC-type dipeptide/oligopeptide/nickel transport system permease subunit n=1 Tax=Kribbella sandramycini TaxID=60450 RepID=A0A841SCZ3_9ACTN|nr:ABC-type dipeptide/oligopeptide/nickel transport system permease subunit [Kribbella sandramycini]
MLTLPAFSPAPIESLKYWWFILFPGLALLITTLAFNLFGDGVRDAFDPRADRT